jgi:hypothetical protein
VPWDERSRLARTYRKRSRPNCVSLDPTSIRGRRWNRTLQARTLQARKSGVSPSSAQALRREKVQVNIESITWLARLSQLRAI